MKGTQHILVVEDEPAVRRSICRILSRHRYQVMEAVNGADAIRLIDEHGEAIRLVITDLGMPEMGGRELIERLGQRGVVPRILVMTGSDEQEHEDLSVPGRISLLEKPFTIDELLAEVHAALPPHDGSLASM